MYLKIALVFLIYMSQVNCAQECPIRPNVIAYPIADAIQCDKFHFCERGFIKSSHLCNDGFVFDGVSCVMPFGIDCSKRSGLQEPKSHNENCPRLNGIFPRVNECKQYSLCQDGSHLSFECQGDFLFDIERGVCARYEEVDRPDCKTEEESEFKCPANLVEDRLIGNPESCIEYYICSPSLPAPIKAACGTETVFNDEKQTCDLPENVPECRHYTE